MPSGGWCPHTGTRRYIYCSYALKFYGNYGRNNNVLRDSGNRTEKG